VLSGVAAGAAGSRRARAHRGGSRRAPGSGARRRRGPAGSQPPSDMCICGTASVC